MEPLTAIVQAMGWLAFPLVVVVVPLALVAGPIFILRFCADRLAERHRRLSDLERTRLVVRAESGRLSPVVVPSGKPSLASDGFELAFNSLRAASVAFGIGGWASLIRFPGSELATAAMLLGFPGFLFVLAFERRFRERLKALPESHERPG